MRKAKTVCDRLELLYLIQDFKDASPVELEQIRVWIGALEWVLGIPGGCATEPDFLNYRINKRGESVPRALRP